MRSLNYLTPGYSHWAPMSHKPEHTGGRGLNEIRLAEHSRAFLNQCSLNVVNINVMKLMT